MNKRLGVLWLKKTKADEQYFSGVLEDMRGSIPIVVFRNTKKEKPNQPDFTILLSEPRNVDLPVIEEGQMVSEPSDEISLDQIPF